jgi:hypothetical protein
MSDKTNAKKFSCVKCGAPLVTLPPDDVHNTATRTEDECGHSVKVEHKCEKCGNINTIYWCHRRRHPDWYA